MSIPKRTVKKSGENGDMTNPSSRALLREDDL